MVLGECARSVGLLWCWGSVPGQWDCRGAGGVCQVGWLLQCWGVCQVSGTVVVLGECARSVGLSWCWGSVPGWLAVAVLGSVPGQWDCCGVGGV